MSDDTNAAPGQEPALEADTAASDTWQPTDYSIAPEDHAIRDEIIAMDPFGYASRVTLKGAVKIPNPKVETLHGNMKAEAERELAGYSPERRSEMESKVVLGVLEKNRARLKHGAGLPSDALPVHREAHQIGREVQALHDEFMRNELRAEEVRWENEVDPVTGQNTPKAVHIQSHEIRRMLATRQAEIRHHLSLLTDDDGNYGFEAKRRIDAAMLESVAQRKAIKDALADQAEVRTLTEETLRKNRIQKRVDAAVRGRTNEL